jgi:hypothetical protein
LTGYRGTTGEASAWLPPSDAELDIGLRSGGTWAITEWRTAHPGDFLFVPAGWVHGFRGSGRASMLLMFAPGGPREDDFETLARLAEHPMTEEERPGFMLRHDTYWV